MLVAEVVTMSTAPVCIAAYVSLDGIDLRDFDFVDLGRVRYPSNTVPVTIKSLVFSAAENPVNPAVAMV